MFLSVYNSTHTQQETLTNQPKKVNKMRNLNEMNVVNREYDLESGFFWVEFENGKSLQCCLKAQYQDEQELLENGPIYLEMVELDNSGFDQGLSYDCNAWAKDEDGEMCHIEDFLLEQARKAGLQIVA